jgi:hypothetical protein
MRLLRKAVFAAALLMLAPGSGLAAKVIIDWQGMGRSDVFTIARKAGSWQAAWDCDTRNGATIAVLNADSGVPVDYLGASYRGERLISKTGRFQLDTNGTFCRVTVTTSD